MKKPWSREFRMWTLLLLQSLLPRLVHLSSAPTRSLQDCAVSWRYDVDTAPSSCVGNLRKGVQLHRGALEGCKRRGQKLFRHRMKGDPAGTHMNWDQCVANCKSFLPQYFLFFLCCWCDPFLLCTSFKIAAQQQVVGWRCVALSVTDLEDGRLESA